MVTQKDNDNKLARRNDRPVAQRYWFDPFAELDRFFDDPFFFPHQRRFAMDRPRMHEGIPRVDISDEGNLILIKADMPGVPKENVDVLVEDNVLEIKARSEKELGDTTGNYIRRERRSSSFQRCFSLPDDVKADEIKAQMRDGVLHVTIPKVEPKEPKKVSVSIE